MEGDDGGMIAIRFTGGMNYSDIAENSGGLKFGLNYVMVGDLNIRRGFRICSGKNVIKFVSLNFGTRAFS